MEANSPDPESDWSNIDGLDEMPENFQPELVVKTKKVVKPTSKDEESLGEVEPFGWKGDGKIESTDFTGTFVSFPEGMLLPAILDNLIKLAKGGIPLPETDETDDGEYFSVCHRTVATLKKGNRTEVVILIGYVVGNFLKFMKLTSKLEDAIIVRTFSDKRIKLNYSELVTDARKHNNIVTSESIKVAQDVFGIGNPYFSDTFLKLLIRNESKKAAAVGDHSKEQVNTVESAPGSPATPRKTIKSASRAAPVDEIRTPKRKSTAHEEESSSSSSPVNTSESKTSKSKETQGTTQTEASSSLTNASAPPASKRKATEDTGPKKFDGLPVNVSITFENWASARDFFNSK